MFEYPLSAALAERATRPVQARKEDMVSPLRYPGGKAWLARVAGAWAKAADVHGTLVEPFAGGASVGLWLMKHRRIKALVLNDADPRVFNFWKVIFQSPTAHVRKLLKLIETFNPEPARLTAALREEARRTPAHLAFATLLQNRFSSNGQLDFGKGLRKSGYNGRGLSSMWYPDTLRARIEALLSFRAHVHVLDGDAWTMRMDADAFYLDPPYPSAAKRLYARWETPPMRVLAGMAATLAEKGPVMVSWKDSPVTVFENAGLKTAKVAMQTGKAQRKYEVLAFSHHAALEAEDVL